MTNPWRRHPCLRSRVKPGQSDRAVRYRWLIVAAFQLSTTLNYLDRQIFTTLGPSLCTEFHIDTIQFGWIVGIFSSAYALAAPFAGMLIDRVGLNLGASLAVGLWSFSGIATGFTSGLRGLIGCRTVLGVAEAGGIPAAGKAVYAYLKPSERALGSATNQIGVSLGLIVAPPFATWVAAVYGWRTAFLIAGCLGLLWIPLWNLIARAAPAPVSSTPVLPEQAAAAIERPLWLDSRLWALIAANALTMVGYSLWTNWIMFYYTGEHHLTLQAAAAYAWIPPLVVMAAGLAGGLLSKSFTESGLAAPAARFRVCLIGAAVSLLTLAVPFARTPALATIAISISFGAVAAMSTNLYSLPLDLFGGARAAAAVSALVSSYGAMQLAVSPLFGWVIRAHHHGFAPLSIVAAFTPAAACFVLWRSGAVAGPAAS